VDITSAGHLVITDDVDGAVMALPGSSAGAVGELFCYLWPRVEALGLLRRADLLPSLREIAGLFPRLEYAPVPGGRFARTPMRDDEVLLRALAEALLVSRAVAEASVVLDTVAFEALIAVGDFQAAWRLSDGARFDEGRLEKFVVGAGVARAIVANWQGRREEALAALVREGDEAQLQELLGWHAADWPFVSRHLGSLAPTEAVPVLSRGVRAHASGGRFPGSSPGFDQQRGHAVPAGVGGLFGAADLRWRGRSR
jgi:hypothetical protein